ncbi:MAG TPA: hypothetical protein VHR39_21285 [Propionibacteriaceae bacterium]|jgi:hypothetical protein|nr:hypothetical protein [Propionibacteriaceae bacterium]
MPTFVILPATCTNGTIEVDSSAVKGADFMMRSVLILPAPQ